MKELARALRICLFLASFSATCANAGEIDRALLHGNFEPFRYYLRHGGDINARLDPHYPETGLRYLLVYLIDFYNDLPRNQRPEEFDESRQAEVEGFHRAKKFALELIAQGAEFTDEHATFLMIKVGDVQLVHELTLAQEAYRAKRSQKVIQPATFFTPVSGSPSFVIPQKFSLNDIGKELHEARTQRFPHPQRQMKTEPAEGCLPWLIGLPVLAVLFTSFSEAPRASDTVYPDA